MTKHATRNHFVQTEHMAASIVLQLLLKAVKDSWMWFKKSIIWKSECVLFKLDRSTHVNLIQKEGPLRLVYNKAMDI